MLPMTFQEWFDQSGYSSSCLPGMREAWFAAAALYNSPRAATADEKQFFDALVKIANRPDDDVYCFDRLGASRRIAQEAVLVPPQAVTPEEPRLLDEREVISIAQRLNLPRELWGTSASRLALAMFANEAWREPQRDGQ